jgi:hypothetical protein
MPTGGSKPAGSSERSSWNADVAAGTPSWVVNQTSGARPPSNPMIAVL